MVKLYVGNLPYKYKAEDLKALFAAYGEVVATVIEDRMSGRSKGFGFVELDDSVSEQAIAELNGRDLEGRNIVVNVARPMEERPKRSFDSNGGGFRRNRY